MNRLSTEYQPMSIRCAPTMQQLRINRLCSRELIRFLLMQQNIAHKVAASMPPGAGAGGSQRLLIAFLHILGAKSAWRPGFMTNYRLRGPAGAVEHCSPTILSLKRDRKTHAAWPPAIVHFRSE